MRSLSKNIHELHRDLAADLTAEGENVGENGAAKTAPQRVAQLQAEFQQILASLNQTSLTLEVEQRLRPCQTEGHRRLQLLGVGAMRLRTAKQAETIVSLRSQIENDLTQLQKFVEAMAAELCD